MPITAVTAAFVSSLNEKLSDDTRSFAAEAGRRFDRIVLIHYGSRSCHAFVERTTGKLIKSGGWKAPQKSPKGELAVRFHIGDPDGMREAVNAATWNGSYLYAR